MIKNANLDNIELDAIPVITESVKTAGKLFDLIRDALPSDQERILRLGYKQARIIAKSQKKASWFKIQKDLFRIRIKEKVFDRAAKRGIPLDGVKQDLLELYNSIADE